jgi:hypothetical protein
MGQFELLQPIADAAFGRFASIPLHQLTEHEQTVILVWSLDGEVGNGGFEQFYFNSSGDYAAETVRALERIGAHRTAAIVAEASQPFPTQPPPADRDKRITELDTLAESARPTWDRLEREFYTDPDGLGGLLVAYLKLTGSLPAAI